MDKMHLSEIFTAKRCGFIELGLSTYFILKRYGVLTTAIYTDSASTVHKSFKMFQNFTV